MNGHPVGTLCVLIRAHEQFSSCIGLECTVAGPVHPDPICGTPSHTIEGPAAEEGRRISKDGRPICAYVSALLPISGHKPDAEDFDAEREQRSGDVLERST